MSFSVPPGYRREQPATRPKLDAFVGLIDAILDEDKARPAKQRHTAKRLRSATRRASVHGRLHNREGLPAFCGTA